MQLLAVAQPHRLTGEEYMTLDVAERTELIGGIVYDVSPRNEPHRYAVRILNEALTPHMKALGRIVQAQDSVAVPGWRGHDAPEVDIAVISRKFYHPGPTAADAFAFIEVSHATYRDDRDYKIPLYLNAGVPAWIANIELRQVEHYGSVDDLALPHGNVFAEGESFEVCGVSIAVSDLFGNEETPK